MFTSRTFRRSLMPLGIALLVAACSSDTPKEAAPAETPKTIAPAVTGEAASPSYPAGFITASDITLGPIDEGMVAEAKKIFDAKCHVCHGLSTEKVVGPGWKGVINERKPEWIMNMMLHTQWMVENDPAAQALVEETKTVMPDQELTKEQARAMLELIRSL